MSRIKKQNQKQDRHCIGCLCVLEQDHIGIICPQDGQDHDICIDCSKHFVNEIFNNPQENIPAKCSMCKTLLISATFERQLNENQRQQYILVIAQKEMNQNKEMLVCCPYCPFYFITLKDNTMSFVFCQSQICKKISCITCKKEIEQIQEDYDEDEEEFKKTESFNNHFKCHEYKDIKKQFEDAIQLGQQRNCPGCGLSGVKDDACMHMTCSQCNEIWCYFCGKLEKDLDKENNVNGKIYEHNTDWDINPQRCPMYLTEINELDDQWPVEDIKCRERFHNMLTLLQLKRFVTKIGEQKYNDLVNVFQSCGKSSGYTLEDILGASEIFIIR